MLDREKTSAISKFLRKHLAELLIVCGVLLMAVNAVHFSWRDRVLSVQSEQVEEYQATTPAPERRAEPSHIFIQWRVDTPIAAGIIQDGKWTVHEKEATFLASSARPGEKGNSILYGHNKREILGNIRVLQPGEKIKITTSDGMEHWYTVEKTQQVAADNLEWLQPTEEEVLTIYTCAGFMDRERFLVRALPVEPEPPPAPTPEEA